MEIWIIEVLLYTICMSTNCILLYFKFNRPLLLLVTAEILLHVATLQEFLPLSLEVLCTYIRTYACSNMLLNAQVCMTVIPLKIEEEIPVMQLHAAVFLQLPKVAMHMYIQTVLIYTTGILHCQLPIVWRGQSKLPSFLSDGTSYKTSSRWVGSSCKKATLEKSCNNISSG